MKRSRGIAKGVAPIVVWIGVVVVSWVVRRGTAGFGSVDCLRSWLWEVLIYLRLKNCASANSLTKCDPSRGSMW